MTNALITLFAWTKKVGVNYSQAQKLFAGGGLPGAARVGSRIMVPADMPAPVRQTVLCQVCGKGFAQITNTHLRSHGLTPDAYTAAYPDTPLVTATVSAAISEKITGIVRSDETRQRISDGRKGIRPKNHPRLVVGAYKASDATRAKMSQSHMGKSHTEETKVKIGDGNRGKVMPHEDVERRRLNLVEKIKNGQWTAPFKGREHSEESKQLLSQAQQNYWKGLSAEKRAEISAQRSKTTLGTKRTPEQKQRYRMARVKWMSENPIATRNTSGELAVKAWLESEGIDYLPQFVIPGRAHPYDFFLPKYATIIEFDGAHHWAGFWFNIKNKTRQQIDQMLVNQRAKDAQENWEAGQAGYRIVRIIGYAAPGDSEHGTLEDQLLLQGFYDNLPG